MSYAILKEGVSLAEGRTKSDYKLGRKGKRYEKRGNFPL